MINFTQQVLPIFSLRLSWNFLRSAGSRLNLLKHDPQMVAVISKIGYSFRLGRSCCNSQVKFNPTGFIHWTLTFLCANLNLSSTLHTILISVHRNSSEPRTFGAITEEEIFYESLDFSRQNIRTLLECIVRIQSEQLKEKFPFLIWTFISRYNKRLDSQMRQNHPPKFTYNNHMVRDRERERERHTVFPFSACS